MKKIFILMYLCFFIFIGVFPVLAEDSGKRASLGVSIGSFPVTQAMNAYRLGGEFGFQFTERVGIKGEFAYAFISSLFESTSPYYSTSGKTTYTCIPISVSVLFSTPVGEKFSASIGAGLGYYLKTFKEELTGYGSYQEGSETDTDKIKGFAPHVSIGIESSVSSRIAIFGEVKQIVGKIKYKDEEGVYTVEGDVHFGGPEFKIGIRFYFK